MTASLFAAKELVPATVTEAPASLELKSVVAADTVSVRLAPRDPKTTFPLAVSVPAAMIVTSEFAVTGAWKVLTALTVTVCALVEPRAVLPRTVKPVFTVAEDAVSAALIVTSAFAVTGAWNVLAALTVTVCALVKPRAVLPRTVKAPVTVDELAVSPLVKVGLA